MKLFFILSGEHPTLPRSEVKAILESEGVKYRVLNVFPHVLRIDAPLESCDLVYRRASMTLQCCRELFISSADYHEIYNCCKDVDWSFIYGKTYAVRVKRVEGSSPHLSTRILEREIGAIIYRNVFSKAKVNLVNPEVLIQGIITNDKFLLGISMKTIRRGVFELRRPKYRPFFHPSSLDAIISRLFVNLSRAKPGSIFLDPFCGAGGFLIEAYLIGCHVIGLDIDSKMISGAKINLKYFNVHPLALIHGDARNLPFRRIDAIATDPPYGRSASTRGERLELLIKEFLCDAKVILNRNGCMCIASPSTLNLEDLAKSAGFKVEELHLMRVHKSLTRIIAVLKH